MHKVFFKLLSQYFQFGFYLSTSKNTKYKFKTKTVTLSWLMSIQAKSLKCINLKIYACLNNKRREFLLFLLWLLQLMLFLKQLMFRCKLNSYKIMMDIPRLEKIQSSVSWSIWACWLLSLCAGGFHMLLQLIGEMITN